MPAMAKQRTKVSPQDALAGYDVVLADVVRVIEEARRAAARLRERGHGCDVLGLTRFRGHRN